jgi:tRNA A-37 threonylcarbamoyl transferase component Bud32
MNEAYLMSTNLKPLDGSHTSVLATLSGSNWQVWIDASCVDAQILESCTTYYDFIALQGTLLKNERHTKILRIMDWPGSGETEPVEVILKWYSYSPLTRLRTLYAHSKAQRDFDGLHLCRNLGVPVVQPVAWGVERWPAGMVRSCFLITRYVGGAVTLRDWLKAGHFSSTRGKLLFSQLMSEMGENFRKMHGAGFFHFRPATKDILVYEDARGRLGWNMLDFAYARSLGRGMPARWAQKRDLGTLLASVAKYADEEAFDPFWAAYLPDPVAGSKPETVMRRAHGKKDALLHRNPMHRAERLMKRWIKKKLN